MIAGAWSCGLEPAFRMAGKKKNRALAEELSAVENCGCRFWSSGQAFFGTNQGHRGAVRGPPAQGAGLCRERFASHGGGRRPRRNGRRHRGSSCAPEAARSPRRRPSPASPTTGLRHAHGSSIACMTSQAVAGPGTNPEHRGRERLAEFSAILKRTFGARHQSAPATARRMRQHVLRGAGPVHPGAKWRERSQGLTEAGG